MTTRKICKVRRKCRRVIYMAIWGFSTEYIEKEQDGYLLKDKISQKRKYPEQQTKVPLQDSEELFIRNWAKTQCESSREFTQCPRARVQAQSEAEIPLFNETLKVERILELRDTEPL